MNYLEFMNALSKNDLTGVYLIECKEDYLKDNIIYNLKDILNLPDFNFTIFKGKIDYENLKTSIETFPVMDEKRYIVWEDIDLSKNRIKEYKAIEEFEKSIKDVPSYTALFIFADDKIFKGSFYKKVKEYHNIVEIGKLNNSELRSFIGKRFVRNKKKISKKLIDEIIDRFSYLSKDSSISLYDVVNTIDKIISNSSDTIVKEEDVRDQLDKIVNLNIFNLTDALSERDITKAMKSYNLLISQNEDIYMIYHMILRHVRNLISIKATEIYRSNLNYCLKITKLSKFEYNKLLSYERNFTTKELIDIHTYIYNMDRNMKSTNFDMELNMQLLILKFMRNSK
ncbi:MAG: DNA polymerase III subunit delta [Tissierellia bacterium]|nr:DNA polymerase III subunit delta [Tissierellia bacterium]